MRVRDRLLGGWTVATAAAGSPGGGSPGGDGSGGSPGGGSEGGGDVGSPGSEGSGGDGGGAASPSSPPSSPSSYEPGPLSYLLSDAELIAMCKLAKERRLWSDSSVVHVRTPVKLFGDIHGQYSDLLRYFASFGSPAVDVEYVSYLFLGDYVDRGTHSLEVLVLLLALKICHPQQVHLLRGNHEDEAVNALYGFKDECLRRCAEGLIVWRAVNALFEMMPVAALVDGAVLCVHGGLGLSLHSLEQLKGLPRPAKVDMRATRGVGRLLNDILWSDPTDSDCVEGVVPNARGPNTVQFGPDRVRAFCDANALKLVVRAHQCVRDGFEYFAQGRLLTVFSAPDYGARFTNDGAMLVINRDLHVLPRVLRSRGTAAARPAWLLAHPKRPFTPPRGRPPPRTTRPLHSSEPISVDETPSPPPSLLPPPQRAPHAAAAVAAAFTTTTTTAGAAAATVRQPLQQPPPPPLQVAAVETQRATTLPAGTEEAAAQVAAQAAVQAANAAVAAGSRKPPERARAPPRERGIAGRALMEGAAASCNSNSASTARCGASDE